MIEKLVESKDLLLHHRINSCSHKLDRRKLAKKLIDNMIYHNGVGLSANQIGIWERVFCMMKDEKEIIVCFNPRIVKSYKKEIEMEEGCLSYPGLFLNIVRPQSVIVKYETEDCRVYKVKLDGMASRIFQHEYDHMQGIDFTQRVKS